MVSRDTVTEGDVRHLLGLVDRARAQPDGWSLPAVVLSGLQELVPCTEIAFQLADPWRRELLGGLVLQPGSVPLDLAVAGEGDVDVDEPDLFWDAFWDEGGCSYPLESGDYSSVLRRSDRIGDRAFAATPMGAYMRLWGVRHGVIVALPPQGRVDRRLLLFRHDGPDFTDREVLLLRLFRPHLLELHAEQQRRLREPPPLTPRQWEVLRLVADGASNARVARTLSMSEATVRKHLENAYARLGAANRTEAAARVADYLPAGPEPAAPGRASGARRHG